MSDLAKSLIGKMYPVKDTNNKIVGFRRITEANHIQNAAGMVIKIGKSSEPILLTYVEALKLSGGKS